MILVILAILVNLVIVVNLVILVVTVCFIFIILELPISYNGPFLKLFDDVQTDRISTCRLDPSVRVLMVQMSYEQHR